MRPMLTRWAGQILVMLSMGAAGCGLPDYEKRMDAQRARVAEFDELNRLLDDPIDMPIVPIKADKPETQPAWPFAFFLRLPKGYAPGKEKLASAKTFPLLRYTSPETGMNIFVAAALAPDAKKADDPSKHLYQPATLRGRLRLALADFCFKEYAIHVSLSDRIKLTSYEFAGLTPYPDAAPTIVYQFVQYDNLGSHALKVSNPFTLEVYHHENEGRQVVVVFQRPARLANMDLHRKTVEACLGTLDLSAAAASKRVLFKKSK